MKKTFGQLIKELRDQKGWSAYALAQRVGISNQAIGNLERTGAAPSFDTVRRLAVVLEFSLDLISDCMPPVDLPEFVPGKPRGRPRKSASSAAGKPEASAKKPGHRRKK